MKDSISLAHYSSVCTHVFFLLSFLSTTSLRNDDEDDDDTENRLFKGFAQTFYREILI